MSPPLKSIPGFFMCTLLLLACKPTHNVDQNVSIEDHFVLDDLTILELQQKFESGEYTSHQVVEMYLQRIDQLDKNGPQLNSVIELNPDALAIAKEMDRERKRGKVRGPLHGIPILVKDNINTGDNMRTSAGSLALHDNIVHEDALLVKDLREGGAVILGKTNLSEWSNFRSTQSIGGWSSRGGQTKNPYILDQLPCGSSSGSAVAVSSNLCMASVGTSTDGSIACPASMNGVVGIRPTVGLICRKGLIPISKTFDTPGSIARNVTDATILLESMINIEQINPELKAQYEIQKNYLSAFHLDGLKGKRIGVEKAMLGTNEEIGLLLEESLKLMKENGAIIVEVSFQDQYYHLYGFELEVLKYEFKNGINRYLSESPTKMNSLEDIIQFNNQNTTQVMPFFNQELLHAANEKKDLTSEEYQDALEKIKSMRVFIENLITENKLDALCGVGNGASGPACMARCPSVTVPMGEVNHLPMGITFFSKPFDEQALLSIAYAYEQASLKRTNPKFLNTTNPGAMGRGR